MKRRNRKLFCEHNEDAEREEERTEDIIPTVKGTQRSLDRIRGFTKVEKKAIASIRGKQIPPKTEESFEDMLANIASSKPKN